MSENDEYQEVAVHLREMQAEAEKCGSKKCADGGEAMFYFPYDLAIIPGHIYSQNGITEATEISGFCEYHFDRLLQPGWTDAITGEKGDMPDERA